MTDHLLTGLTLKPEYRSDEDALVDDFFVPCLERSCDYARAAGYFTSDGLALVARGLYAFMRGGGKMRLVASPVLNTDDYDAISKGYRARQDVIQLALLSHLDLERLSDFHRQRMACLAWLIAGDRLEIKIAVRNRPGSQGIYHEKIGIFRDEEGNQVAFGGSSNETAGGLLNNFETVDVFSSWEDPDGRVERKSENFERLWSNETAGLIVVPFPEAAMNRLLQLRPDRPPTGDPESVRIQGLPKAEEERLYQPAAIRVRPYQGDAIAAWMDADCRGIFEMATGTGKTITALSAAAQLKLEKDRLIVVILVPYQHLVDQWVMEAAAFGLHPVKGYGATASWQPRLKERLNLFRVGARDVVSVVATHTSAASEGFLTLLEEIDDDLLLIADETHHLGAEYYRTALQDRFSYRLGLSATPERWLDEEGTEALTNFFGPVVYRFGLGEAIRHKFLTPYEYLPHLVELDDEEIDEFKRLTALIGQQMAAGDEVALQALLGRRAEILNTANGKLSVLQREIDDPSEVEHSLFYCAPGQIEDVVGLLGHDLGIRVHRFTAREDIGTRQQLLRRFDEGRLQGLVAMRCLDEGVDVPSTRTAYILASSSNPRQFVQRRGRILRKHPGKTKATIHDLITVPNMDSLSGREIEVEAKIFRRELHRFTEFANHAINGQAARDVLWPVADALGVLDAL